MYSPACLIDLLSERARANGLWQCQDFGAASVLISQGARCSDIFVLTAGLVKLTYLTTSGDEWIKSFVIDAGLFGALEGKTARFGASAIEPSTIIRLPAVWVRELMTVDPQIASAAAAFSAWLVERKQRREEALLCDSAEDRYRTMMISEADLLARLPQGDIARFLRVTPVAFSRIKRRVHSIGLVKPDPSFQPLS